MANLCKFHKRLVRREVAWPEPLTETCGCANQKPSPHTTIIVRNIERMWWNGMSLVFNKTRLGMKPAYLLPGVLLQYVVNCYYMLWILIWRYCTLLYVIICHYKLLYSVLYCFIVLIVIAIIAFVVLTCYISYTYD